MPCTEMLFSGNYSDYSLNNPDQLFQWPVAPIKYKTVWKRL